MKKLEHVKLDFSTEDGKQQPLYCPFTGGLLVPSDPNLELQSYPETVIAAFDADSMAYFYIRDGFEESDFEDFEDLNDLKNILEQKISVNSGILILELSYYGNNPSDFGGSVFFLEIPNCFVN